VQNKTWKLLAESIVKTRNVLLNKFNKIRRILLYQDEFGSISMEICISADIQTKVKYRPIISVDWYIRRSLVHIRHTKLGDLSIADKEERIHRCGRPNFATKILRFFKNYGVSARTREVGAETVVKEAIFWDFT